jgi:hypothetical protein
VRWRVSGEGDGHIVVVDEFNLCRGTSPVWTLTIRIDGVVVDSRTGAGPFTTTFDYPAS